MEIRYTNDFYCHGWYRGRRSFMNLISYMVEVGEISRGTARKLRKWSAAPKYGDVITILGKDKIIFESFA